MDYTDSYDMVAGTETQCVVHDQTPGSEQKKINIVVRDSYTVKKVFSDITTQFRYTAFDLVFQPDIDGDLVYLNDCRNRLIFDVTGFDPSTKNTLILLPSGDWDGNIKNRYHLPMHPQKVFSNTNVSDSTTRSISDMKNNIIVNNIGESITGDVTSSPSTMTIVATNSDFINTDSLNLSPMSDPDHLGSDDDLALGASASPTETEPINGGVLGLTHSSPSSSRLNFGPMNENDLYDQVKLVSRSKARETYDSDSVKQYQLPALPSTATTTSTINNYVGLVNQAMTCYLNSLLQALFMTPEFRNALYRWEFDNDNEGKNIPYQLQKLFLNLQTSKKSSVETTDLTRSFGWDSTEAWQQHDIQELCRVMFDALEHKFKNTKQAKLISNLYEGKMIDYVKCLECNTEKTREDTFLDIPLPVRPFGSTIAYGSIEEALRAFVQPETLDGNNQYFCEKCNKKCDAHKGLKFKTFPYILTLHLKRFDFDYQTMHRIKLNDKVTFPQTLNLNTFINATDAQTFVNLQSNGASNLNNQATSNDYVLNGCVTNTDDCSTTDSGSAMEEDCSSGIATTASSSQHENDMNDDDEGIDMSTSTDHRIRNSNEHRLNLDSGSYLYELFAIMIHSGSASGGHYYAYIKEFENNEWFCFNDQSVSPITQEDIQKSFGGSTTRAYYSSVYSSSTNAYMLMYRQIDPKHNESSMKAVDFPDHINTLLPKIHAEDETRCHRANRHHNISNLAQPEQTRPRVYFYNPHSKKLKVTRVYLTQDFNINTVLENSYKMLNVDQLVPLSRCRLVGYDASSEVILQSFEDVTDSSLADIRAFYDGTLDFLLEYLAEGQEFERYKPGGATWYVYMVNLATMAMDGPFFVYSMAHECSDVLKHSIAVRLHVRENQLLLATLPSKKAFVAYDPTPTKEAQDHLQTVAKAQFRNLTYFYMNVPSTEPANLEIIGIPAYESQMPVIEVSSDVVDAVLMNGVSSSSFAGGENANSASCLSTSDYVRRESPLPPAGQESNSEDSSLSDGDRTLVESLQNRGGGDSQISSSSHSPQLSSPEEESSRESLNRIQAFFNSSAQHYDSDVVSNHSTPQIFHAIKTESTDLSHSSTDNHHDDDTSEDMCRKPVFCYKILVDSHMKMSAFKRHIETLLRVPANYFKIQRKHSSDSLNPANSLVFVSEGETLFVELGRVLQPDEHKAKIFFMRLSELDNDTGKLPCICEWIYNSSTTVAEAKKELITKLHRINSKYQTLTEFNCRLWLKGGRNPIKILADEETLTNDARTPIASEFLIQECEDGVKPQTSSDDSLTIFVRRWHPDKLQLDKFQEITLEKDSEFRNSLAKITDIPEERISYSKINSSFPCTNISLLSINGSMSWFSIPATVDKYPLTTTGNGNVYFYKDVDTSPKELSSEERRELNLTEKSRLDRLGCMSTSLYSPRRERALKIYLDSPQTTTVTASASASVDAYTAKAED